MEIEINVKFLIDNELSANQYLYLYCLNEKINNDYFKYITSLLSLDEYSDLLNKRFINLNGLEVRGINLFNNNSVNEWIEEWLNLWPTEVLHGYRVSGNTLQVYKKMKIFCKKFPNFDKDLILKATTNYLKRKRNEGWGFTKKNSKFIFDTEGSTLEQECIALLNGVDIERDNSINL